MTSSFNALDSGRVWQVLEQPYDYAVARLEAVAGDVSLLPAPLQTLLLVESAQGIIDNGGLAYFYEADFPNNPPYADFADAYRRIGAESAAHCIEASSLMFPFDEPHFFEPLRALWLEKLAGDAAGAFVALSTQLSGDATVWEKLANYVVENRSAFLATQR